MKKDKTVDQKCPSCAAPLFFNPKAGNWTCEYCNSVFTLKDLEKNKSHKKNDENEHYDSYVCKNCGASIIADENTAATFCLYCGNTAILKSKLSGKFEPSKLIPFKVVKQDAINAFKALKKGRPLLPNDFVSEKNIEKITGLYVPFWLFDIGYSGEVFATGTRVKSWTTGNTHYTKTDTYRLERDLEMNYHLIPVDGSQKFSDDIMNTIEPFDYNDLVDYNYSYLSGFLAEKYDVESDEAVKDALDRALTSTLNEARRTMNGYSSVIIKDNNLAVVNQKTTYVLLPVWMVNVKYKEKYYLFAMNGQTGEFIGDMPLDKNKSILIAGIIFAVSLVILILCTYIFYKMTGGAV